MTFIVLQVVRMELACGLTVPCYDKDFDLAEIFKVHKAGCKICQQAQRYCPKMYMGFVEKDYTQ